MLREIRASGLQPGDRFAYWPNGIDRVVATRVDRYCTGSHAWVEIRLEPDHLYVNALEFGVAETVWVDR